MKRFVLLFALILTVSCDTEPVDPLLRDQANNPDTGSGGGGTNATIEGRWFYSGYDVDVSTVTTTAAGSSTVNENISIVSTTNATVDFNPDGTMNQAGLLDIEEGTSPGMSTSRTIDLTGGRGNYMLTGTVLSTDVFDNLLGSTMDSTGLVIRITTLSNTTLNLEFSGSNTTMNGADTVQTSFNGVASFTRS